MMYGLLRSAGCGLPVEERHAWSGHLCGLCLELGNRFGQAARLATNADAALLIALCEAQAEEVLPRRRSACLLRRPVSTIVDEPSHPAVQYAGSTAMLMAANKIRDNLLDDNTWLRGLRRTARALAENWRGLAGEYLLALGFRTEQVEHQFLRQTEVEAQPGGVFTDYSQPTELAVGAVFAHTALLQGKPHNYDALFAAGRGYGRIMLLLDAARDYTQDALAGHFNPLQAAYAGGEWRQQAQALFREANGQVRQAVTTLELAHPALLHSLLLRQVGRAGGSALGLCRTTAAGGLTARTATQLTATPTMALFGYNAFEENTSSDDRSDTPQTRACCNTRDCCGGWAYTNCHCPPCGEGSGCDCSQCDCREYDWSTCGCCPCSDCSNCDCSACCDCGNCDCGGCDCNCN